MYLKINYTADKTLFVVHKGTDCQLCRFFGVYYYFFGKPFRCFLLLQKQTYYYLRYKYNIYYTRQNHAHLGRTAAAAVAEPACYILCYIIIIIVIIVIIIIMRPRAHL